MGTSPSPVRRLRALTPPELGISENSASAGEENETEETTEDVTAIIVRDIDLLDAATVDDDDGERDAKILIDGGDVKWTVEMKGAPISGILAKHRIILSHFFFSVRKEKKMKGHILALEKSQKWMEFDWVWDYDR